MCLFSLLFSFSVASTNTSAQTPMILTCCWTRPETSDRSLSEAPSCRAFLQSRAVRLLQTPSDRQQGTAMAHCRMSCLREKKVTSPCHDSKRDKRKKRTHKNVMTNVSAKRTIIIIMMKIIKLEIQ